jgi:hypothetical protein
MYIQEVIQSSVDQAGFLCLLVVCQERKNAWNADFWYLPLQLENPWLICLKISDLHLFIESTCQISSSHAKVFDMVSCQQKLGWKRKKIRKKEQKHNGHCALLEIPAVAIEEAGLFCCIREDGDIICQKSGRTTKITGSETWTIGKRPVLDLNRLAIP